MIYSLKVQLKTCTALEEENVTPPPCVHYCPYSSVSNLMPDF